MNTCDMFSKPYNNNIVSPLMLTHSCSRFMLFHWRMNESNGRSSDPVKQQKATFNSYDLFSYVNLIKQI